MFDNDNSPIANNQGPSDLNGNSKGRTSRKLLVISLLVLTAVLVAAALYYILQRNSDTDHATANEGVVEQISPTEAGIVEIRADGFWPQTIKVKAGQQVTFTNKDTVAHRVIANEDTLKDFDSAEMLQEGDSYTYVFDSPGTFSYYDSVDGINFSGTVEVN